MSTGDAISGGINGAKLGGQLGGGWGAIIGGVAGILLGSSGSDPAKAQLKQQQKFNDEVIKHTTQSLFDLQRQRVSERMRSTAAINTYQDNERTALSTLKSQAGAADIIGSSAKALGSTVDWQTSQAIAQERFNFDVGIDNYNTNVRQIVNQGVGQLKGTIQETQQQASLSLGDLKAGYEGVKSLFGGGNKGGFSGGLQLGSQPTSTGGLYSSSGAMASWSSSLGL